MTHFKVEKTKDASHQRRYDIESQDTVRLYITSDMDNEPILVTADAATIGARYYDEAVNGRFQGQHIRLQKNHSHGYHGIVAFRKDESLSYQIATTKSREEFETKVIPAFLEHFHKEVQERIFVVNRHDKGFTMEPAKVTIYWALQTFSRNGQPHLHLHFDYAGMGLNQDGVLRCTDSYNVFADQKKLGEIAGHQFRYARRTIQQAVYDREGYLLGITEEQRKAFSGRAEAVQAAREHIYSDKGQRSDLAASMTRGKKEDLPSREELNERNIDAASKVGLTQEGFEADQKEAIKWLRRLEREQLTTAIDWEKLRATNSFFSAPKDPWHVAPNQKVRDRVRSHTADGVNQNQVRTINSYKASWRWKPTLSMAKNLLDRIDFSKNRRPVKTFLKSLETAVRPHDLFGRGNFVIVHDPDKFSHADLALTLEKAKHCSVFFMGEKEKTLALTKEREKEQELSR